MFREDKINLENFIREIEIRKLIEEENNTEVKDYKLYSWEESNRMSDHLPICVEV